MLAPVPIDAEFAEEAPVEQPGMTDDELVEALEREFEAANGYHDQLFADRELARKYYEAQPFGNEIKGRSQIVLPDVQEAIDYMVPSVLRTFVSGGNVVEFEATDEQSEKGAEEATQAIQYSFMRLQDGERILHDMLTDGLLEKTGIVKSVKETREKVVRQKVQITDPVQLDSADGEIEDVAEQSDGSMIVTIKTVKREARFIDVPVPPECFRFSPTARNEDEADYLAHVEPKTRSDLVDMGYDRDQVYSLSPYSYDPSTERRDDLSFREAESTKALERVLFKEEYARIDRDGDGIAERIKVCRVENTILIVAETGEPAIEEIDDQPFTVMSPYPRPHRLVGYSLFDKVADIQLSRSTVARQLLDGMYISNMPRPIIDTAVAKDAHTIDDLLSPIPGAPIRAAGGAASVQPYVTSFDVGKSLSVMEWLSGERESRTGITRLNQGLDADALNNVGVSTTNRLQDKGEQQEEFVARNMAWALVRIFGKKYRLMKAEGEPFSIKVDGQYKKVDPSTWPDEINILPRVGLGSGSKDKRIQYRMSLVPIMAEGVAAGQVSPKNTFMMIDGLVRDMQLGTGDDYWIDPDAPPEIDPATGQPKQAAPQPPDPALAKVQADAQANEQKLQFQQQQADAALAAQQQQAERKMQLDAQISAAQMAQQREKYQLDLDHQREKAALEIQLKQERADAEARIAVYGINTQAQVDTYSIDKKADVDTRIGKQREGGALDA